MKHILLLGHGEKEELASIVSDTRNIKFHVAVSKNDIDIQDPYMVALLGPSNSLTKHVRNKLKSKHIHSLNPATRNKYCTYKTVRDHSSIRQPLTIPFSKNKGLMEILAELDHPKEAIFKPKKGTRSEGIMHFPEMSWKKVCDEINSVPQSYIISEYIQPKIRANGLKREFRLFYTPMSKNGTYSGSLFISGIERGAFGKTQIDADEEKFTHMKDSCSEREQERLIKIGHFVMDALYQDTTQCVYPRIMALDMIGGKDRKVYFLEANSSPVIFTLCSDSVNAKIVDDFRNTLGKYLLTF